jgi:hypothetical protein
VSELRAPTVVMLAPLVDLGRSDTMSKRMEACQRNPKRTEQRSQLLFPQLVRGEWASSAIRE